MKIYQKISQLKKNMQDIDELTKNIDDSQSHKIKIDELNKEVLRLKNGINESVRELEEFLGEEDARN